MAESLSGFSKLPLANAGDRLLVDIDAPSIVAWGLQLRLRDCRARRVRRNAITMGIRTSGFGGVRVRSPRVGSPSLPRAIAGCILLGRGNEWGRMTAGGPADAARRGEGEDVCAGVPLVDA